MGLWKQAWLTNLFAPPKSNESSVTAVGQTEWRGGEDDVSQN